MPEEDGHERIGCSIEGYFKMLNNFPDEFTIFDFNGGTIERDLYGETSEDFISVYMIADKYSTLKDMWKPVGTYIAPGYELEADGRLNEFPNSLDVTYKHRWAEISTYKELGEENGILRVTVEPYIATDDDPEYREMYVWVKNHQISCARIRQYKEGAEMPPRIF